MGGYSSVEQLSIFLVIKQVSPSYSNMPSNKVTKDRVLICIISQDNEISIPDIMADLRHGVQELNHEVLFFSSQKDQHPQKYFTKPDDSKYEKIDSHFIFEGLGYGELQKLAFHYSIKHKFDIVIVLHQKGSISQELLKSLFSLLPGKEAQAFLGSRFLSKEGMWKISVFKRWASKVVTFLQNKILNILAVFVVA